MGCIGGIGVFLTTTSLEVATGVSFEWDNTTFVHLGSPRSVPLWSSVFALEALLRLLSWKITSPLLSPVYFLIIPGLFYASALGSGHSITELRTSGWLPDEEKAAPFYEMWTVRQS